LLGAAAAPWREAVAAHKVLCNQENVVTKTGSTETGDIPSPATAQQGPGGPARDAAASVDGAQAPRLSESPNQRVKGDLGPADEVAQARKAEAASRLAEAARRYLGDKPAVAAAKPKTDSQTNAPRSAAELSKPVTPQAAVQAPAVAVTAQGAAQAAMVQGGGGQAGTPQDKPVQAAAAPPAAVDDDGPADDALAGCLSFLSKLYGHGYSEEQLRVGIPLEAGGLTLAGLIQSAERIGMEAKPERCRRLSKIPRLALPAILLLKDGRACVLLSFTAASTAEVFDPRGGQSTTLVPLAEIERNYSGELVYLRPQFRFDTRSEVIAVAPSRSWFWGTLMQNWWIYGNAVVATIVVNLLAIASPIFVMTVYDRVVPNNAVETLWVLAIGIAGVAIFDFCLRTLRGYLVDTAGKRMDVNLGVRLFDHVVRMRMDARKSSAGSLASIMREFDFLREFLSSATVTAVGDLPFIFLFIAIIYFIGGPVAYVLMVAVPFVLLVSIIIQIPLHKVTQDSMRDSTQKNAHLFEVLHGIETIKAIRAESWAQRIWENLVGLTAMSSMKMKMLSQVGTHVTMLAQLLVTVGIIVVGVHVLKEGDMTQGALIACVLLSSRVMAPLAQVAGIMVRYEQTKTAFNALHSIMQAEVERPASKKLIHKPYLQGAVEFKEVSFAYPRQDTNALNDVSFSIKPGERVAFIGRVGSGKSTVLKLIQNLYQPAQGFVRVDDLDTRQIELADLRRQVGYVPQETMLFHGSIRDNLVQGAPHATDEQVMQAAHIAGLDDMIKQSPKGFEHEVGEHGTLLSGGQRQMIVLARALVLDPPVLLMDEPTSHMDNYAERQFIARMREWSQGRTVILVTHRASLLALVDRLIVMDKGQVVADGPKEDVLNALAAGKIGAVAA
jgi:ATP-binding cassette subfamily C protein LapB